MTKELSSPEIVRKLLRYDPENGKLFWLPRPREEFTSEKEFFRWNNRYAGAVAGTVTARGYILVKRKTAQVAAHRLAWLLHTGSWPCGVIDHINGDAADNRIINLRDVSVAENARNAKIQANNTSGYNGVSWCRRTKKWQAYITIDGRQKSLGAFGEIQGAIVARNLAEAGHGFTERHGK